MTRFKSIQKGLQQNIILMIDRKASTIFNYVFVILNDLLMELKAMINLFPYQLWKLLIIGSIMATVLFRPTKENSIFSLHSRIRTLQSDYRELQGMLKDKLNNLNTHFNTNQHLQNRLMQSAAFFKQEQTDIHEIYSNNLIVTQIKLQEESEMKEIIENYQKRIMELQSSLISKEEEIIEQIYEGERQAAPRRENMQVLNKDNHQKMTIKRALQDLKKLNVEIDALEYSLNSKTQKSMSGNMAKDAKAFPNNLKDQTKQGNQNTKGKDKTNELYRDKLLSKVYKILEVELTKQMNLRKQIAQLKLQWKNQQKQLKHFIESLKNQGNDKAIVADAKVSSGKSEHVNFLDELYKAEIQQAKENLFTKVDQNVNAHKVKTQKKKTASRQKVGKINKQN